MATSSTIMRTSIIKHAICMTVVFTAVAPTYAFALNLEQSATLPFGIEYETNPQLVSNNRQSVKRTIFTPSYSLMATQNNDQFFANLKLNIERSSNQTASANREDPNFSTGWTHDYETGQFGIIANFSEQSTRTSEFDDNGLVTNNNNTRKTKSLGGNWSTELSDRYSLSVNLNATDVEFDGVSAGLNDYKNKSLSSQVNYSINEKVNSFARLSLSRFEPVNTSSTNFRSLDIGANWTLSENFTVSASGGVNETGGSNGASGWQADVSSVYTTERTSTTAGLSRSRSPSGEGIIRESNQLKAGWSYLLSEKANIGVNFNYRENLGVDSNDTMRISADYTRALAPEWDFKVSASHRNRDDNISDVSSNTLSATIIYKLPDF